MYNIAVILAAGSGTRMSIDKPKQFLKVAGKTVIEHTVDIFQKNDKIDEITIVVHENFLSDVEEMVLKNHWTKVCKILRGGAERYESSLIAIESYSSQAHDAQTNLIFHDAVRPLVSNKVINEMVEALKSYKAVDVAIPSADTIIRCNTEKKIIEDIPDREYLLRGQTPQGFRYEVIKHAYALALKDSGFKATDDCGIVVKYLPEEKVFIIPGENKNIKLTFPEDIYLMEKLFQLNRISLNSLEKYSDLKNKVIVIFGGNSGIGKAIADIAEANGAIIYPFSRSLNDIDITKTKDVEKALKLVYDENGKIDYVVNCAAILLKAPLVNLSYEKITNIIDVNYKGTVNISLGAYKYLKESNGQLLHFTSSSYTRGRAFYSLYSSTKAAVVNFVQALAEEWSHEKIRVNCINPQRTLTPMRLANFGKEDKNTLLDANQVAKVSLNALISDISGEIIDIKLK